MPITKASVYAVIRSDILTTSTRKRVVALCRDSTDVVLSGGCNAPNGNVVLNTTEAIDPYTVGRMSGWACEGSNFTGTDKGLTTTVYCLVVQ